MAVQNQETEHQVLVDIATVLVASPVRQDPDRILYSKIATIQGATPVNNDTTRQLEIKWLNVLA